MRNNPFATTIIRWYKRHKRLLPWRDTKDPYFIWLSEIILQQTRVVQGTPYYEKFVAKYPTINLLARAEENEVLRIWQGLGYYTRARNLHKCAKVIMLDYAGQFPDTYKELIKLPGIGKYTAAAIASMAFNEPVPVIDGNVYRVLSRYFEDYTDISSSQAYDHFYKVALSLIDIKNPGIFNEALMEFGAVHCTPKNPDCSNCELTGGCKAFANNTWEHLPVKKKKVKTRTRHMFYLLIKSRDKILMKQREEKDIWQGLYEPALVESDVEKNFEEVEHPVLDSLLGINTQIEILDKKIRHVLTHQYLNVNFAIINIIEGQDISEMVNIDGFRWYSLEEAENLPKPILISNFLDTYLNSINLQE